MQHNQIWLVLPSLCEHGARKGDARRRSHSARLLAAVLATTLVASGCGDEAPEKESAQSTEGSFPSGKRLETPWIGLIDDDVPEEWLVRRKSKDGAEIDAREVERARTLLEAANKRFGDHTRMIANRAAQLEVMLAEKGFGEDAMGLIEALTRAAEGSRPTGGFASLCQYYFNLRTQGMEREEALVTLAKRYGSGA